MLEFFLRFLKPGLHVRRKHKNKHKHKDAYTCDKHKHNVTYASAEANKFGAIAQPGCRVVRVKPGLHVRRKHKHKHKRNGTTLPFSCACACAYACVVASYM